MYMAIKCLSLKQVRTLPTIWICYVAGIRHCWLPKDNYEFKIKNLVKPPSVIEMKGKKELFECELLFDEEFLQFNDAEMAIAKLGLGPEWLYKASLTDMEKYQENKRLCALHDFNPPIFFKKFEQMKLRYVRTFNINDLKPGYQFLNAEELSRISRKIDRPFCHPGPLLRCSVYDWYLVDSIVQEVHLKSDRLPNFVVRWVGYEDYYNTVEPLAYVKDTAVYKLFTSPNIYTAARMKNGCLRRRSIVRGTSPCTSPCTSFLRIAPSTYDNAINTLMREIQIEEKAEHYSPEIGFFSYESVADALRKQHRFFKEKFLPLIIELNSTFLMDDHYIGTMCGNLQSAAEFKEIAKWSVKNHNTIKTFIHNGLSKASKTSNGRPHYVSFLVPRKHGTNEKSSKKHLNFHMCVFTVRADQGLKDAIYYDPSPKCYDRGVPTVLNDLAKPKLKSFTQKFGVASEKDDCMLQCMEYLIGLATGEIPFEPNLSQPCRKLDRYLSENPPKKQKY